MTNETVKVKAVVKGRILSSFLILTACVWKFDVWMVREMKRPELKSDLKVTPRSVVFEEIVRVVVLMGITLRKLDLNSKARLPKNIISLLLGSISNDSGKTD